MSEYLLGWHEIENSIAYCLIALEVKYFSFLDRLYNCLFLFDNSVNISGKFYFQVETSINNYLKCLILCFSYQAILVFALVKVLSHKVADR